MRNLAIGFFGAALAALVPLAAVAAGEESRADVEPSVLFVIPVDYPGQVEKSLVVAESIRLHGGSLDRAPIRIYTLKSLRAAFDENAKPIARLGVDVREVDVPREAGRYVLGGKPFAAAQAEKEAQGVGFLALLAPNTLVLSCPEAFVLPEGKLLGYSTVHHQNIGSLAAEPADAFWSRLYAILGVPETAIYSNRTLADGKTVRLYYNAGSFVVRPRAGLLQAWAKSFRKLYQDPEIAEMCQQGPRNVFLHQAALAGATVAHLQEADTVELPHTYSYPLFFELFHGGDQEFRSLENVVTMRYEFRYENLPEGWEKQVTAPPELLGWVRERLAAAAH